MDIKGPGIPDPTLPLSLSLSPLSRYTVAVQRAICALNRNALWNNARIPLATKDITLVVRPSTFLGGGARCRGLVPTFFLCLAWICSDRIWKCLPDVAGDRLQFVPQRFGRLSVLFFFRRTERKKELLDFYYFDTL